MQNVAIKLFRRWLDVLFPPSCALCEERTPNLLCADCQEWLAPPDPALRCRHCFVEDDCGLNLCGQCVRAPLVRAPRAFLFEASGHASAWKARLLRDGSDSLTQLAASLFLLQWSRLQWPHPDRLAFLPYPGNTGILRAIAQETATLLNLPLTMEFAMQWTGVFQWRLRRKQDDLLENKSVLLLDFDSDIEWQKKALGELWPAYPLEVRILSLFEKPAI